MKIDIIKSDIKKTNTFHLVELLSRVDHKTYIVGDAGVEHYKLLTYLSKQLNNTLILELGTHHGTSCLCLCENRSNKVITYDLSDREFGLKKLPENLTCRIGNIFEIDPYIMLEASLIFLDTQHDGPFETQIYNFLVENDYKGMLLLDDIYFNTEMINFWNNIKIKKYDITSVGHGVINSTGNPTGTGILDFNNNIGILKLND